MRSRWFSLNRCRFWLQGLHMLFRELRAASGGMVLGGIIRSLELSSFGASRARHGGQALVLGLCLLWGTPAWGIPTTPAPPPGKTVVLLCSGRPGDGVSEAVASGFRAELPSASADTLIYVEYLDLSRFPPQHPYSAEARANLEAILSAKYQPQQVPFDLIACMGIEALEFGLQWREHHSPQTPVVFGVVNEAAGRLITGQRQVTGVFDQFRLGDTLDLALRLLPQTTHAAFVINPTREEDQSRIAHIRALEAHYRGRLTFVNLDGLSAELSAKRILSLPPSTIILYFGNLLGGDGKPVGLRGLYALLPEGRWVPAFSIWERDDVLGGHVFDEAGKGRALARQVGKVLRGAAAETLPIVRADSSYAMVSYPVMQRYGIAPEQIPEGTRIRHAPQTQLSFERSSIWLTALVLLVLSTASAWLIWVNLRLRRAQAALQTARNEAVAGSQAKSAFLANMSHEIRTPMNGIMGMTQMLLETRLGVDQREYLRTVYRSAETLLRILDDILDLSRIQAGKLPLERNPVDLLELIESVGQLHSFRAIEKSVQMLIDFDPTLPRMLQGDSVRIEQVLSNLVGNAVKFTDHGEILIKARGWPTPDRQGYRLRLSVEDTGIGIPEAARARLFEDFYQVDDSMTRHHHGSGLGLSICRHLVGLMGGAIKVQSTEGRGSEFVVELTLPLAEGRHPLGPSVLMPGTGGDLLLLSANLRLQEIVSTYTRACGWSPVSALTVVEAIDAIRTRLLQAENLVIMIDNRLDALNLIGTLRRDCPRSRILLLSHLANRPESQRLEQAGFNGWIPKPVRFGALREALVGQAEPDDPRLTLESNMNTSTAHVTERPSTPPTPSTSPHGASLDLRQARVLMVEDNAVNQKVAGLVLNRIGCTFEVANNGLEALQMLEGKSYDIILMDCQMPVMDGYTCTQRIREQEQARGGHIPIVAVTAHAMAGDREKCLESGMDDYVTKPINLGIVEKILRQYVHKTHTGAAPGPTGK